MFEKYLEAHADHLRKLMLREPRGYPADGSPEWNHNRWSITGRIVSESFTDTLAPATLPP
jgi:hypothetical protein